MSTEKRIPLDSDPVAAPTPNKNISPPDDPLKDILGPGSFTFRSPSEDSEAPPELQAIFDEYSIGERSYRCILRERDDDESNSSAYVESFNREYPSSDYIGTRYGPGDYVLIFLWRGLDPETQRKKNYNEKVNITISDKYSDRHEDYMLQKTIKRMETNRAKIKRARIKSLLDNDMSLEGSMSGNGGSGVEAGKKYFEQISEGMKLIGVDPSTLHRKSGIDWEKLTPILLAGIPAALRVFSEIAATRQSQFNTLLTLMLNQSNKSSDQMLEIVRASQGQGSGNQIIKEFTDMIRGTVDIKELLTPEKQSVADRVFDAIEKVSPMIVQMMAMNAQQRMQSPLVNMAKAYTTANPDFEKMRNDQSIQQQVIARLDSVFGWEQADVIIQVMGYQRTENNPRLDHQRYPQGSPEREAAEAAESEVRYNNQSNDIENGTLTGEAENGNTDNAAA